MKQNKLSNVELQPYLDFADVHEYHHLKRALEVAITGKHNILIVGADNLPIQSIEKATFSLVGVMGEVYYDHKIKERIRYISNHIKFVDVPDCKCELRKYKWQDGCNCDDEAIAIFNEKNLPMYFKKSDVYIEYGVPSEHKSIRKEESTKSIIRRIEQARSIQYNRNDGGIPNNDMKEASINTHCVLDYVSVSLLNRAKQKLNLTPEQTNSILKVSRTIADIASENTIAPAHLAEAIQYKYMITG